MDEIKAMRVFARVADECSFAVTARALELQPSTVTRLVAELEAHLGARLMNRTTRHLELTEIGRDFLSRARRILAEVDDAAAMVSAGVHDHSGTVRVLVQPAVSVHRLAQQIPRFHAQYPQLTLRLDAPGQAAVTDDDYDITIVWSGRALEGEFIARKLTQSEVILCATPGYLDQRGRPDHPAGLVSHDALMPANTDCRRAPLFRRAPALGRDEERAGEMACAPLRAALLTPQVDVNYLAALAGLGIAALPAYMLGDALRSGALERVLPD